MERDIERYILRTIDFWMATKHESEINTRQIFLRLMASQYNKLRLIAAFDLTNMTSTSLNDGKQHDLIFRS